MNFEEFRRKIVLFFEGKQEDIEEETPTMSVSGGGIAGVSDNNPPAPLRKILGDFRSKNWRRCSVRVSSPSRSVTKSIQIRRSCKEKERAVE